MPVLFLLDTLATFFMSAGNAFLSGASTALALKEVDNKDNVKSNLAKMESTMSTSSIIDSCIGLVSAQFFSYRGIIYTVGTLVLWLYPFTHGISDQKQA